MAHKTPNSIRHSDSEHCSRLTELSLRLSSGMGRAALLAGRAKRFLPVLAALLLLAALPRAGWGQENTMVYDGTVAPPGTCNANDECCQKWTITFNEPADSIMLTLAPAYGVTDAYCIDEDCWEAQSTPFLRTFFQQAPFCWGIKFSHLDPAWVGPFPFTLDVELCASNNCWRNFPQWAWTDVPADYGGGYFNLTNCSGPPSCEDGCSYITAEPDANGCGVDICFVNQSGSDVTSFSLSFSPGLSDCQWNGSTLGGDGPKCSSPWDLPIAVGYHALTGCWTQTYNRITKIMTWSEPGPPACPEARVAIPSCTEGNSMCVFIPYCADETINQTITLTDPYCDGSAGYINISMKRPGGPSNGSSQTFGASGPSEQNFPNPVEASSGFKTTIPFSTSVTGTAYIRIVDQTGKEVMKDNEEATYAGEHFFYFTATDLPAGTYYYQIEFPQGVVIQNKTMLVVK